MGGLGPVGVGEVALQLQALPPHLLDEVEQPLAAQGLGGLAPEFLQGGLVAGQIALDAVQAPAQLAGAVLEPPALQGGGAGLGAGLLHGLRAGAAAP